MFAAFDNMTTIACFSVLELFVFLWCLFSFYVLPWVGPGCIYSGLPSPGFCLVILKNYEVFKGLFTC